MLYRSTRPVALDSVDLGQYNRLHDYLERCRSEGLVFEFGGSRQLSDLVHRHLLGVVRERFSEL